MLRLFLPFVDEGPVGEAKLARVAIHADRIDVLLQTPDTQSAHLTLRPRDGNPGPTGARSFLLETPPAPTPAQTAYTAPTPQPGAYVSPTPTNTQASVSAPASNVTNWSLPPDTSSYVAAPVPGMQVSTPAATAATVAPGFSPMTLLLFGGLALLAVSR